MFVHVSLKSHLSHLYRALGTYCSRLSASKGTGISGRFCRLAKLDRDGKALEIVWPGPFSAQANPDLCQRFICKSVLWSKNTLYVKWVFYELVGEGDHHIQSKLLWAFSEDARCHHRHDLCIYFGQG